MERGEEQKQSTHTHAPNGGNIINNQRYNNNNNNEVLKTETSANN